MLQLVILDVAASLSYGLAEPTVKAIRSLLETVSDVEFGTVEVYLVAVKVEFVALTGDIDIGKLITNTGSPMIG